MYHTAHSTLTYNRRFRSRLRKLDGVGDVGYDEHLFIGCFKAYVGVYIGCLEVCSVYIWCIYMYNGCHKVYIGAHRCIYSNEGVLKGV